jgi:hypothetical protein
MSTELEEEIKRLPPGTAMIVSNEIERPIVVNIRPRRSKHGGVSTPIVMTDHPVKGPVPRREPQKGPGLFLRKVLGPRGA